jgi:mRNA interferase HicA
VRSGGKFIRKCYQEGTGTGVTGCECPIDNISKTAYIGYVKSSPQRWVPHPFAFFPAKGWETTHLNRSPFVKSSEFKRWLAAQGATFTSAKGSHLKVELNGKISYLPMHHKDMKVGTVAAIKKQLDLK